MPTVTSRTPLRVSSDEKIVVRHLDTIFRSGQKTRLVADGGQELVLPTPVLEVLRRAVHLLALGQVVTIVPYDTLLTTQEAAELLNVSRPFLVKLLQEEAVPYIKVGTHRRIRFDDLMSFKKKRDGQRSENRKHLTEISEEIGLYETDRKFGEELGRRGSE